MLGTIVCLWLRFLHFSEKVLLFLSSDKRTGPDSSHFHLFPDLSLVLGAFKVVSLYADEYRYTYIGDTDTEVRQVINREDR